MSIFWIIVGTLLFLNLLWAWHADAVLSRAGRDWRLRLCAPAFAVAMGGLLVVFILGRGGDPSVRAAFPTTLVAAIYLWHLLVLPVWLVLAPPVEVVRATRKLRQFVQRRSGNALDRPAAVQDTAKAAVEEDGATAEGFRLSRRDWLVAAAAAPPSVLAGVTGVALHQMESFRLRRLEIPLAGLPRALDGLTVAHLSDLHVGVFTKGKILREFAEATNALEADLILLTGDLINDDLADLPDAIAMVRSLKARYGVYLCEGNHDLIPGPHGFGKAVREAGLNLLVNETRLLEVRGAAVEILGLRWGAGADRSRRADDYGDTPIERSMEELLRLRERSAFPLLMAHHPHAFDAAAAAGIPLTLSGHTHGGQIMLNEALGFGPALFRYWSGLYRSDGTDEPSSPALVVSNGTGNWFPLRTAAPAEILHLTLRASA